MQRKAHRFKSDHLSIYNESKRKLKNQPRKIQNPPHTGNHHVHKTSTFLINSDTFVRVLKVHPRRPQRPERKKGQQWHGGRTTSRVFSDAGKTLCEDAVMAAENTRRPAFPFSSRSSGSAGKNRLLIFALVCRPRGRYCDGGGPIGRKSLFSSSEENEKNICVYTNKGVEFVLGAGREIFELRFKWPL